MIKHLTKENFKEIVADNEVVIIDFWATWCGPCRMLGPVLEEFSKENENIIIGKVDVDEQPDLANEFQVMSIPTLVVFKNGVIYRKNVGYIDKEEISTLVK